jgi:N-acetylglutamate synthase
LEKAGVVRNALAVSRACAVVSQQDNMPTSPMDNTSETTEFHIRAMTVSDFEKVRLLWEQTEGVSLNESDEPAAIAAFLMRNANMSAVAHEASGRLVGAVLCGHDGRRGYLHHLAMAQDCRRRGVARLMIAHCFAGLARAGIPKCNLFLLHTNEEGREFWRHNGWIEPNWGVMQKRVLPER